MDARPCLTSYALILNQFICKAIFHAYAKESEPNKVHFSKTLYSGKVGFKMLKNSDNSCHSAIMNNGKKHGQNVAQVLERPKNTAIDHHSS